MTLLDWIECGYSRSEARELMIEFADERHYEELANIANLD